MKPEELHSWLLCFREFLLDRVVKMHSHISGYNKYGFPEIEFLEEENYFKFIRFEEKINFSVVCFVEKHTGVIFRAATWDKVTDEVLGTVDKLLNVSPQFMGLFDIPIFFTEKIFWVRAGDLIQDGPYKMFLALEDFPFRRSFGRQLENGGGKVLSLETQRITSLEMVAGWHSVIRDGERIHAF